MVFAILLQRGMVKSEIGSNKQGKMEEKRKYKEGISVIICCFNSADKIKPTLEALQQQKNAGEINWEVLLVDNASTDATVQIAKSTWKRKDIPFVLLEEKTPGKSFALKTGIDSSKYSFFATVDDDNWVPENYIERTLELMKQHQDIGILGCQGEGVFEEPPPPHVLRFRMAFAIGPQGSRAGYVEDEQSFLYGACSVYRRETWDHLWNNGFNYYIAGRTRSSLISGEDSELSLAFVLAGKRLWFEPSLVFKHDLPARRFSWQYFLKLTRAFGESDLVINHYKVYSGHLGPRLRRLYSNYYLALLYTLYHFIKSNIRFVFHFLKTREDKNSYIIGLHRSSALIKRYLLNRKLFNEVKKDLANCKWMVRSDVAVKS